MSKLADLYEASKTPVDDRIQSEKNILLVVPDKKHDIGPVLSYLGLSPFEVALTWPKKTVDAIDEIDAVGAKVVLQVDCSLTRKRHSINTQDLKSLDPYRESVREAIADRFVCLHHHDEFSIKDGLGTIGSFDFKKKQWKGLLGLLKAQRRSFCCITNHGSVGGWIKQYNACKKAGVKALFGMEAYTSNYRGDDPEMKKAHRSANHLVLIANNEEGFFNIIRIHNDAQLNGFYYTPRVNREALEKWGKGIIGMSACMAGELPRLLMEGKDTEAKEFWEFHSRVFDAFYIEIQIIEAEEQREANRRLIQFARSVGAPLVLSCDSHYLDPEYAETHDMLMCLRQKKTIMDKREKDDVWSFDVRNLYYRDAAAMRQVFENGYVTEDGTQHAPFLDDVFTEDVFNEAIANTRKIAIETQNIKLDATIKLPKLHENGKEVLRKKLNIGFSARGLAKKPNADEYFKRIKSEFEAITKMGWGDYFLIMERIITDTKEKYGEWAIGYGRGSAAGSLVSYCLGLTGIDPIEYGLLFERFLEEGRPDPPDIDTDFDPRIRDWVKQHIVEVFGANNVCSIGTYQSYKTRAVILDVARALGENLAEVNAVTKRIEPLRAFEDDSGEEFKVDQMEFDDICEHYPELKTYFEAHPEVRRHAEILRNQVKNMGTHAGGVIISDLDLRDRIPVLYDKPSSENRQVISAWAESGSVQELSSVGLVKYDILGLNNLPVISDCVRLIEQTTGVKLPREEIPISDREAIFLGSKRDMVGIFQFENPVTKPIADKVGMESLMDIAVVTSLIRPGPMDAMIGDKRAPFAYAARKHGEPYEAPEFIRYALKETYGIMVFQEDVMRLSKVLSGFSAAEANKLRKAAGKKIKELMASIRDRLITGAKPRIDAGEITQKEVEEIWEQIETFAGYGFCKAHAVTYGAITTVEMWLKHNFPIQFCTALINNTKLGKKKHGSDNILVDYVNYARRREIAVLGPDVNMSGDEFRIEDNSIRFALGHVKGVATAAKLIETFQPFTGIQDFYDRVKVEDTGDDEDVPEPGNGEASVPEEPEVSEVVKPVKKGSARRPNRKVVENLIAAGAFDRFGTRNEIAMAYWRLRRKPSRKDRLTQKIVDAEEKAKEAALGLVAAQQSGVEKEIKKATKLLSKAEEKIDKAKQAVIEDDKVDEVIADTEDGEEVVKKDKDSPPLDRSEDEWYKAETEVLGTCLSRPVLYKQYEEMIRKEGWYLISEIDQSKKKVMVFGEIIEVRQHISKAGNSMHIVKLSDGIDTMSFFVFQGGWEFFKDNFRTGYIGAISMAKFDDSDNGSRFFDDRGKSIVLKKG